MSCDLGIDTGGTYTDAVLLDDETGQIEASAKALTTRHNLSLGISAAIQQVFREPAAPGPAEVRLVGLSTTLATNAIVEDQGSPVCLILIGYDQRMIRDYDLQDAFVADQVVHIDGGHDIYGQEAQPLDEAALREAVESTLARGRPQVFAVSGYFGVRNPTHEERARSLIQNWTGLPVTCANELTSRLNSVRRATTVALNARLVPLLLDLVESVRVVLEQHHIAAPLMIMRGDGSLMRAEWALRRPIETVLSGPAASVVGAMHLTKLCSADRPTEDVWVVDMGGTTTDIAAIRDGHPELNREGAQVGRWRTMVEAVDVHTVGLGGDSHVRVDPQRELKLGPQRVVPLSLLAHQHAGIVDDLRRQVSDGSNDSLAAQFLVANGAAGCGTTETEQLLLARLAERPRALTELLLLSDNRFALEDSVEQLLRERLVLRAGFTPTDALHALGELDLWNAEAAALGASILAAQRGEDEVCLCNTVTDEVSRVAALALVESSLMEEGIEPQWRREPIAAKLLAHALGFTDASALRCTLALSDPLVAIGAPVGAYLPATARHLSTQLIMPPHAAVANAAGAVVGNVVQTRRVLISPLTDGRFRVHLPGEVLDFATQSEAVDCAEQEMQQIMEALGREAGAEHLDVRVARHDQMFEPRSGWGDDVYVGTELVFTVIGQPRGAVRR
mgnify:CR=1 FL=1